MFLLEKIKTYAKTNRIFLINREEKLSYTELDELSEAFAAYLLDIAGDDRSPVVVYGHKETLILPCLFGALKAGRAYVPVDITVPPDRLLQIIEDVSPKVVVDFYGLPAEVGALSKDLLEGIFEKYRGRSAPAETWASGEDHAYILFTSGSTGRPKGVPITVNNLTNLYQEFMPEVETAYGNDVILNQISYSFDVSVVSIYMGVSRGMTLFTIDKDMVADLKELFARFERSNLALWVSTPSFAEMCCVSDRFERALLPRIEKFLFCGEVLTHKLTDELFRRFPGAGVVNTYGPTEATVLVTTIRVTEEMAKSELSVPIGRPLPEVTFRVADEKGNTLPAGEQGELLIISDNVGPGYWKRPDLTEKVFFEDKSGKRGYRTGDKCFETDGLYYYCGRLDNQLKVNGYRVEIEDIERNLIKIENVARAAVLPVFEEEKVAYLAAFVLLTEEDGLGAMKRQAKIKGALSEFLPSYMIPRKITALPNFPLNVNGKVDKKELGKLLS